MKIALTGNPNCGKTTLFNAWTGSNQFVGNWPGVTVEKKEGKLKGHEDVTVTDLPGIYSLAPYSPEEIVARNVLIHESPDVLLNIVDATNIERNLYLTTQLLETGIPMVVALNMMDVVHKQGTRIDTDELSKRLGVPVVCISALKKEGMEEAVSAVLSALAQVHPMPVYPESVESALVKLQAISNFDRPRWQAVQLFNREPESWDELKEEQKQKAEQIVSSIEKEMDEDSESILSDARYTWIASVIDACVSKKNTEKETLSDRIDRVVTSRVLGLPIFALIMFSVYWIAMGPFGSMLTDWANDGVFGDGWHFLGIGSAEYEAMSESYGNSDEILMAFMGEYLDADMQTVLDTEAVDFDPVTAETVLQELIESVPEDANLTVCIQDEETLAIEEIPDTGKNELMHAISQFLSTENKGYGAPKTSDYGLYVPGIPVLLDSLLAKLDVADWLNALIMNGIVAGVGAVLGFVPQMLVLFFLLAFLEGCGYMARIAFVLDRIFRRFGLSGKSFIPMLVGTGCGVPGIMASRTIENEQDRRMTIITTTFIPCGAKIPFIAMMAGALFHGNAWVSTSCYFIGMAAILISGIMLKKTRWFAGEPAPFVMELPMYHMPTLSNLLHSMWERGSSFIKKAGTIILLSTIIVWFTTFFGFVDGSFRMLAEEELDLSILASIGRCICWIFTPLGFGTWQATVASLTGLVAKENIVGTMGILYGGDGNVYATLSQVFNSVSGTSFLLFNLLCAPCFAAIGAIKREMNDRTWTWFAIVYECGFAYVVSLLVYQFGSFFAGNTNVFGVLVALVLLVLMLVQLFKPNRNGVRV